MRATTLIGASVAASFLVGAITSTLLHAQSKPPAYIFAEIAVKDKEGYAREFLPKAQANIKESGGKYLAGGFEKVIPLAGSPPPNRVLLLQFPDVETLNAFFVKQQKLEADVGGKFAEFRAVGIEGAQ